MSGYANRFALTGFLISCLEFENTSFENAMCSSLKRQRAKDSGR